MKFKRIHLLNRLRYIVIALVSLNLCYLFYQHVLRGELITCESESETDETKEALEAQLMVARRKVKSPDSNVDLTPTLFIITPTYKRPQQKAELNRLSIVLRLVPNLHWIVIEDATSKTDLVTNFLLNSGLNYTHLHVPTPWEERSVFRGRMQRNVALQWLRDNAKNKPVPGVIYFADDDNTFSPRLFDTMRDTKLVAVWPVGFGGGIMVEKPIVSKDPFTNELKVVSYDISYRPEREFGVDMAGFAFSYNLLLSRPKAKFDGFEGNVKQGLQEEMFIKHLASDRSELEPKSVNEVLVWHTKCRKVNLEQEPKRRSPSDIYIEV